MRSCDNCDRTIVAGGRKFGDALLCSERCEQDWLFTQSRAAGQEEAVQQRAQEIRGGKCPLCRRPGPVDFEFYNTCMSFIVITIKRRHSLLACRRCGDQKRFTSMMTTFLLGWWGLPWGPIYTVMQIVANVTDGGDGAHGRSPSPTLLAHARAHVMRGVQARERMGRLRASSSS